MNKNLKPFGTLTEEEQRKLASKGGKASVKARQQKKRMKEYINILLQLDVKNEDIKKKLAKLGIEENDMTNEMAMMTAVLNKAMKGDMQAVNFLRDTSGQMPANKLEIDRTPVINDDI